MQDLYYNLEHPSSYGGVDRLALAAQRGRRAITTLAMKTVHIYSSQTCKKTI